MNDLNSAEHGKGEKSFVQGYARRGVLRVHLTQLCWERTAAQKNPQKKRGNWVSGGVGSEGGGRNGQLRTRGGASDHVGKRKKDDCLGEKMETRFRADRSKNKALAEQGFARTNKGRRNPQKTKKKMLKKRRRI